MGESETQSERERQADREYYQYPVKKIARGRDLGKQRGREKDERE